MLGKIEGRRISGWQRMRWLDGITDSMDIGWTLGIGDGQGGLACCDSRGCKESDTTERQNWTELNAIWKGNWFFCSYKLQFSVILVQMYPYKVFPTLIYPTVVSNVFCILCIQLHSCDFFYVTFKQPLESAHRFWQSSFFQANWTHSLDSFNCEDRKSVV